MKSFTGKLSLDVLIGEGPARDTAKPRIILLHGMRGGSQETWNPCASENPWYLRLAETCGCALYSITYDADFFQSRSKDVDAALEDMALELVDFIVRNDLLANATFFVAYSYGGLILKHALCDSFMVDVAAYFARRSHQTASH